MLTKEETAKLSKKLDALKKAQEKVKGEFIKRLHLDKKGDEHWEKYVKKTLKIYDKHLRQEYRATRVMLIRELYNRRRGRKSPWITF